MAHAVEHLDAYLSACQLGIVLASDDPRGVVSVLRLSRAGYRKMVQNLAWALGYNVIALPIAAGVAAPIGLTIPPGLAATPDERLHRGRRAQRPAAAAPRPETVPGAGVTFAEREIGA